jgi:hypothetical protein
MLLPSDVPFFSERFSAMFRLFLDTRRGWVVHYHASIRVTVCYDDEVKDWFKSFFHLRDKK